MFKFTSSPFKNDTPEAFTKRVREGLLWGFGISTAVVLFFALQADIPWWVNGLILLTLYGAILGGVWLIQRPRLFMKVVWIGLFLSVVATLLEWFR